MYWQSLYCNIFFVRNFSSYIRWAFQFHTSNVTHITINMSCHHALRKYIHSFKYVGFFYTTRNSNNEKVAYVLFKQTKNDYPADKACIFAIRLPPNGGISNFMNCLQFLHALNSDSYIKRRQNQNRLWDVWIIFEKKCVWR